MNASPLMRRPSRVLLIAAAAVASTAGMRHPPLAPPKPGVAAFGEHLNRTVPAFLEQAGVPGASVALVHDGEVSFVTAYGFADRERHVAATSATVYNVGSISKTVTAWGVMRLVEQGRIGLDDPVERYLRRWHLPASSFDPDGVTIRRLLSHTAGLSTPSVYEYASDEHVPSLVAALSDSNGVRQVIPAGTEWRYSGGGYEILQLLIEEVSGRPFAEYMRTEVLLPLGMRSSTFDTLALSRAVATPYDSGRAIARHRYVGLAAAGLYSTAGDLARFLAAGIRGSKGEPPGRGVLTPTSVAVMQSPAPHSSAKYGFYYGLGYNLFPLGASLRPDTVLGDGAIVPGHMGQNTGWGAVIWSVPATGDGFVMLTNHSKGFEAYRWALCDWVRWVAVPSFGYLCDGRDRWALGTLGAELYAAERREAPKRIPFVDSLATAVVADSAPGMAILVMRDGEVLHAAGYGVADLATRAHITQDTPFNLASLSKQFTAFAIMRLVERGALSYDDTLSRFVPELGDAARRVTIRELLTHSSGLPDYYPFLRDWSRLGRVDNALVRDTLRGKALEFPPGTAARYSNSGYVLLASVIEKVTKRPFREAMSDLVFGPSGMHATIALDGTTPFPRERAVGYDTIGNRFRMADYGVFENAKGQRGYTDLRTVGAGGMYSTLRDLAAWTRTLDREELLPRATLAEAFRAQVPATDARGIDTLVGYGYGWIVSRRNGAEVAWHDGGIAGFRNLVVRVPASRVTVFILSNFAGTDIGTRARIATRIVDRITGRSPAAPASADPPNPP
jgi:CubicO group peptidase (beta-lactamase class C family)